MPGGAAADAPRPLGSSPKLRDGLSLNDAVRAVRQRRAEAAGNEGGAAPAGGEAGTPPPPGVSTTRDRRAARGAAPGAAIGGDGAAATGGTPAAGGDPLDGLIERMRPNGAAGGATQAGATGDPAPGADPGTADPGATADPPATGGIDLAIDGKAHRFTPEQLVAAVRMSGDYTRKAQELATLTRTVNEKAAFIDEIAPILIPEIERRIKEMEGGDTAIDWEKLYLEDPAEYHRRDAQWKNAQLERERLNKLTETQTKQSQEESQRRIAEGHSALVKALPGWDDPAMRGRLQSEMIKWGRANRFSDAELNSIQEPRHVIALAKAMMFDRMMGRVSTDTPRLPRVTGQGQAPAEPGARRGGNGTGGDPEAEARFQQRPSVNNALAVMKARRAAAGTGR